MKNYTVSTAKIALDVTDQGRKSFAWHAKFRPYLEAFLPAAQNFLWGTRRDSLAFSKKELSFVQLSLTLCGEGKIRKLNREYRQKDKVTDVLSFPVHEDLRQKRAFVLSGGILELGDIFICKEVAKRQARDFNLTLEQELAHLVAHGFLHLCGLDHERGGPEEVLMQKWEDSIVKDIYKKVSKS